MKVTIQGVSIELTKEQIALIHEEKTKQEKECKSFEQILKHFGFKKIDTKSWPVPNEMAYSHYELGWYAEIQDYRTGAACFLVGKGLKSSNGFPGGHIYESPESVAKSIIEALDEIDEEI